MTHQPSWHLAIDFGARFADFVAWDADGLRISKQANGPDVAAVVRAGLADLGIQGEAVQSVRMVTTAPLNAALDRASAPVALLTTRGFADTLRLGRQNRLSLYDPVATSPAPAFLVPEDRIFEIGGRLGADGSQIEPLSEADIAKAAEAIAQAGVTAVAVCFLFSHVDPAHELQAAEALRAALPGVAISLSHVVDPAPREYDRTVSAALDGWIAAGFANATERLRAGLGEGFAGQILLGDGRGVLVPEETLARHRAVLLTGGPAAAARAGAESLRAEASGQELLVLDMGSKSADIALVREGEPATVTHGRFAGIDLRATMVDMASVPLGGARRVELSDAGPRFDTTDARAPSLDDALAVLGRLPDAYGRSEARIALYDPARPVDELAGQIVRAAARMAALALVRYATRRNLDPLRAGLCVMGGSGPLLATEIAEEIGLAAVIVPRAPAVAGAMGLARAPHRAEALCRVDTALEALAEARLDTLLDQLQAEVPGAGAPIYTLTLAALAQMHPLELTLRSRPASVAAIREELRRAYDQQFGVAPPGAGHVFSIRLHRDSATALPSMPADLPSGATGPVQTEAGLIHLPEGWHLAAEGDAYRLTRTPA